MSLGVDSSSDVFACIETTDEGRTLVVTGPWSDDAGNLLSSGEVDGLRLNYALGFEGFDIEFLDAWPIRRLDLLDRGIRDLTPISRLADTLESLSVQAAPDVSIDLADLPHVTQVQADWSVIRDTISSLPALEEIITWRFDRVDLHDLRELVHLQTLVIKDAPFLRTLDGVGTNPAVERFEVVGARRLEDIDDVEPWATHSRSSSWSPVAQ